MSRKFAVRLCLVELTEESPSIDPTNPEPQFALNRVTPVAISKLVLGTRDDAKIMYGATNLEDLSEDRIKKIGWIPLPQGIFDGYPKHFFTQESLKDGTLEKCVF